MTNQKKQFAKKDDDAQSYLASQLYSLSPAWALWRQMALGQLEFHF